MLRKLFSAPPTDVALRTRWYVNIRWLILIIISVPGILSLYAGEGWSPQVQRDTYLSILAISTNGIFLVLARLNRGKQYYRNLAAVLLTTDILLITLLIFIKGGIESRSPILYTLPILMSAAIFGRQAVYKTGALIALLYSSMITADYFGIISSIGYYNESLKYNLPYVLNSIAFFSSAFLLVSAAADFITRQLIDKEQQASKNAKALERAQSIAKLGSWEWDIKTDATTWSDELYRIHGLRPHSVPVTHELTMKYVHPDDRDFVQTQIDNAVAHCKPFSFDFRIKLPSKSIRFVHSEGQVVTNNKGKPVRLIGTTQDITAERALDKAKDEFVSLASHQLRTPATGVKAYLSMVIEGYAGELDEAQLDLLRQAFNANERQLYVIDGLLSVAGIESGRLVLAKLPTNLNELIKESVSEQQPAVQQQGQTIKTELPDEPLIAEVDPNRLRMVLDNLISNASKYSKAGDTVTVSLKPLKTKVVICVSDKGIGIAKKDIEKLFVKFSRLNSDRDIQTEGTGLGLYLVKYLINLHGGKITVDSKPGKGSTFKLHLPLKTKPDPLTTRVKKDIKKRTKKTK